MARKKRGRRGNTPTSMTHVAADCRAGPTLAASYGRRQCCWHPETPSQSAGIRGASLVLYRCLQRGWSTCALPSFDSLSQAHFQGRTSSPRYGYHRAKAPPVLSRFLIGCWPTSTTAHCPAGGPALLCSDCTPHLTAPRGSIRALQRAPHTLKYCQTRQSSIFMEHPSQSLVLNSISMGLRSLSSRHGPESVGS